MLKVCLAHLKTAVIMDCIREGDDIHVTTPDVCDSCVKEERRAIARRRKEQESYGS